LSGVLVVRHSHFFMSKVYTSTDYNMFKRHAKNRPIKEARVLIIMANVKRWYKYEPIVVNQQYEILNGQHRFEACRRLSIPVRYNIN
jgi:hypothetical protein